MGVQLSVGTMFVLDDPQQCDFCHEGRVITQAAACVPAMDRQRLHLLSRRRPDRPVRPLRLDTLEPGGGGAHRGGRAARIRKAAVISAKPNATGLGHRDWNSVTVKEKFGSLAGGGG